VTPPRLEAGSFAPVLAQALAGGDVACLQLRLKGSSDADLLAAAALLAPICAGHDVAFLVNDRPDLAAKAGADGVHLGQEDAPYAEARALLGAERIVGVTCHASRELAIAAAEAGADYIAFGAFFPTATKEASSHADLELLGWWSEIMTVPSVAIGGITVENCAPLVAAGADFLAVVRGVWDYPKGPGAAVADFNAAIRVALEESAR
jgi:thiamine-phosphate pyrophosphorylase